MKYLREYIEKIMRGNNEGMLSFFLFLLSLVYSLVQRVRVFLYEKGIFKTVRIKAKVISVGNITVGGTGKTPAVISIANAAKERFFKSAILTRGYMGKAKGTSIVSDGENIFLSCSDAGDEPYLMARKLDGVAVVKGKDRCRSAELAIERFGSNLFILDDGFQYMKLYRDMNILLIDSLNPFGNGYLVPRGILRESLMAVRRADIVVLTKADLLPDRTWITEKIRMYNPSAPIFFSYYEPLDLTNIKGDLVPLDNIKGKGLFIFSGLADSRSFRRIMEREGAIIIGELTYPDHFYYSKKDMDNIREKAGALKADMIVTTEKDIVRINLENGLMEGDHFWALRIEFVVEDKNRCESLLFSDRTAFGGDN